MKTTSKLLNRLLLGIGIGTGIAAISHSAHADQWKLYTTISDTEGGYANSAQRDRLSERGLSVSAEYLDQGGLSMGYRKTSIRAKNTTPTTASIDQSNLLLSGRLDFRPDALPGRLSMRLDGHRITGDDIAGDSGDVSVIAPQLSWLSKNETLYLDLGYAASHYQNQLSVRQFTPTVGFGFNAGADWIQLRGYLIGGLSSTRADGKSRTTALETKWTHYFASRSALMPASLTLGITAGERIYAVDRDARSVANLADLEKGAATLGLSWNIAKNAKFFALVGQSRYSNSTLSDDYKLNIGHAGLSFDW